MLNFDGKRSFFLEISCCSELQKKIAAAKLQVLFIRKKGTDLFSRFIDEVEAGIGLRVEFRSRGRALNFNK